MEDDLDALAGRPHGCAVARIGLSTLHVGQHGLNIAAPSW